jgi:hypothetical protein
VLLMAVAAGLVTLGATAVPSSASSLQVDRPVVEQRACAAPVGAATGAMTCPLGATAP